MVISKSLRALRKKGDTVTVLLENKQDLSEALLFERGAIAALTGTEKSNIYKDYKEPVDAYGCLGVLHLSNTDQSYLVLVTGCNSIGRILEVEICRVSQVTVVTMGTTAAGQQQPDQITEMVKFLSSGAFFFSYPSASDCFQLCSSAQYRAVNGNRSPPQYFLWNRALLAPLIHYGVDCDRWMLRLMCGSVEVKTLYCGRHQARACLISRFGCERAGTRFSVRGVDDNGHVAGFVETEQVIVLLDKLTSFVQLRGSVPIFWEQSALQGVGNHRILLSQEYHFSHIAFEKHIEWLISNYGPQVIVNLLGNKEGEQKLSTEYQKHVRQSAYSSDIPMVTFDYNSQCKGHDHTKLNAMVWAKNRETLEAFDYFSMEGGHMTRKQVGTIRTNCMDCMDRTNVVQCFFGLKVLEKQLLEYDLGGSSSIVSQFEDLFRTMWSHNGNNLSMWYTGSAALSKKDRLKDGAISLHRTIHSNFYDSSKQEAIEMLLWAGVLDDELGHVSLALLPPTDVFSPRCYREELCGRYLEYTERVPLRVCVGTWNVNGGKYAQSIAYKNQSLSTWLLDTPMAGMTGLGDSPPDIYAIGLEELVDLNASNIMNTSSTNRKYWSTELNKILSNHGLDYVMLTAHQLVGVCLFVFVQPQLVPLIRDVALSTVKTGMSGKAGNKGAVGVRMIVRSSPICFVCAHMTAHQSHVNERNSDFTDIWKKMTFPNNVTLSSHEYVFWCGDLNYRIDLPIDVVKEAILSQNWSLLQQNDQLLKSKYDEKAFHGFIEGELTFAPTYKYDSFSDDYDTSEKGRIPAWTDRVMWWNQSLFKSIDPMLPSNQTVLPSYQTVVSHPTDMLRVRSCDPGLCDPNWNPGLLMFYGRSELKTSDHRPVIAVIDVEVLQVKPDQREIVARDVTLSLGPPDCTVVISGGVDWEDIQSELIQCGDIIFVRVFEEQLIVTFKDSKSALFAMQLDGLQVEDKMLHVELRSEWPPPEVTEEKITVHHPKIKLTTPKLTVPLNVSDLGSSSPKGSPHLSPRGSPSVSPRNQSPHLSSKESPQDSPKQSPQVSPRGSPHTSTRQSPNASPRGSLEVSPKDSPHSSPYHSAEESPYNSPGGSPQQSPHSSPRESPQSSPKLSRHTEENNEPVTSDQRPVKDKPVVPSRTASSTNASCVSQYHDEISKARGRSTPIEAPSGIGQPYNIKHQAHGQQVGDKLVISKPTSAAVNKKSAPPQRPPNPSSKSDQLARLTFSGSLDTTGPPRRPPPPPNRPQSATGSQGKPPPPRPPQPVKK